MKKLLEKTIDMSRESTDKMPYEEYKKHCADRYEEFFKLQQDWIDENGHREEMETLADDLVPIVNVQCSDEPFISSDIKVDLVKFGYIYARLQMEQGTYE